MSRSSSFLAGKPGEEGDARHPGGSTNERVREDEYAGHGLSRNKKSLLRPTGPILVGVILLAVVLVAVAIAVPIVVLKNDKKRYTDEELYFPTGYNGTTGLNGVFGSRSSYGQGPTGGLTTYDQLVV